MSRAKSLRPATKWYDTHNESIERNNMTLLMSLLLTFAPAHADPGESLEDMMEHLDTLDKLLPASNTAQVRRLMEDELDDLRNELERVMDGEIACPPPVVAPVTIVAPSANNDRPRQAAPNRVMPADEFDNMLSTLRNMPDKKTRLEVFKIAAGNNRFSHDRVVSIMEAIYAGVPAPAASRTVVVHKTPPPARPAPKPATPRGTSAADFNEIVRAVEGESFDDGKLDVLRSASARRKFSINQIITLMNLMTFAEGKIDAAAMLYDKNLDRKDWYKVYGELTFDSDRDKLKKRVGDN